MKTKLKDGKKRFFNYVKQHAEMNVLGHALVRSSSGPLWSSSSLGCRLIQKEFLLTSLTRMGRRKRSGNTGCEESEGKRATY